MSENLNKFNRNKSIPSNPPKQNKVYVVSFSDSSSGDDDNDNNNNYHQKLQTYSVKTYGNVKTDPRKLNFNNVQTSQRNQGYTAYQNIPMNIPNQNFFTMRNPVQTPNLRYNYYVTPITSNYAFPTTQNYNIDTYNRSLSGSNTNTNGNYSRAYYPIDVSFGNIGSISGSIQNNMINPNPTVIPYQRPQSISFRSPNIKTYQFPVFNFKSKIPYAMDQVISNKTPKDKNAIKIQKVVRGYYLRKNLYEYLARYWSQLSFNKQQQQIPYQTHTLNSTSNYRQNYNIGINPNIQSYNPNQKFDSYSFGHTNYDLIENNVSQNNISNQRTKITSSQTEENVNKNISNNLYRENYQKEIEKKIINSEKNNTINKEEKDNDSNNLRSKPKKVNSMMQTSNDRYKQYNSENNQNIENTNKSISNNIKSKEINNGKVYESSKINIENNSSKNSNNNIKNVINIKNKNNNMINKNILKSYSTCNYDKNDPCPITTKYSFNFKSPLYRVKTDNISLGCYLDELENYNDPNYKEYSNIYDKFNNKFVNIYENYNNKFKNLANRLKNKGKNIEKSIDNKNNIEKSIDNKNNIEKKTVLKGKKIINKYQSSNYDINDPCPITTKYSFNFKSPLYRVKTDNISLGCYLDELENYNDPNYKEYSNIYDKFNNKLMNIYKKFENQYNNKLIDFANRLKTKQNIKKDNILNTIENKNNKNEKVVLKGGKKPILISAKPNIYAEPTNINDNKLKSKSSNKHDKEILKKISERIKLILNNSNKKK